MGLILRPGRIVRDLSTARPALDERRIQGRIARAELEARTTADTVLRAAKHRARRTLEVATQRAAELRLDAEAAGRAAGIAEVAALSVQLRERRDALEAASLDRIVELGRLLAERLIAQALSFDPSVIAGLARRTLQEARGSTPLALVCHPEDAGPLRAALAAEPGGTPRLDVLADPQLDRGDLRLETDAGVIEARIGPQLDILAGALRRSLGQ